MSNVQHTVTGVSGGSGGTVTFTWDDPGEEFAKKYEYRYKCHNIQTNCDNTFTTESWNNAADRSSLVVTADSFPMSIPGSASAVYFQLWAVNTNADPEIAGPETTAITVERSNTLGTSPPPPDAPTEFSAAAEWDATNSHWDVALSWGDPSDTDIDKYQYRQSTDGGSNWNPDWEDIPSSGADTVSHRLNGLTASTTYTFQIRAVDTDLAEGSGNGASSGAEATTTGAPNAPTLVSATQKTDDATTADVNEAESQIVLSWTAGAEITGVTVDDYEYRQLVSGAVSWSAWNSISGDGSETTYTVIELLPSTTYSFELRAVAGALKSAPSDSASGTTADPPTDQPLVAPVAPMGLRAAAGNEQATLTWSNPDNRYILRYRYRVALEGTVIDTVGWQQIDGSDKDTTSHTITGLINGTTYSFQVQAVGAGIMIGTASETVTATPRPPRPPTGGGGTSRDSVTAHNSDETIDVTIEKPTSVTVELAVGDQACNTAAPAGSVHLCVQASASGSVESLPASPAFMTIVISPEQWTRMEGAYDADPRRFFLSKRSSSADAWANIISCIDDPGQECYLLQETEQGGATVFVYTIVSFSQYAIRTVGTDGAGGGQRGELFRH